MERVFRRVALEVYEILHVNGTADLLSIDMQHFAGRDFVAAVSEKDPSGKMFSDLVVASHLFQLSEDPCE
jgi:hypothetical protein